MIRNVLDHFIYRKMKILMIKRFKEESGVMAKHFREAKWQWLGLIALLVIGFYTTPSGKVHPPLLVVSGVYATTDYGQVTYVGGESCAINANLETQTAEGIRAAAEYCIKYFSEDKERGYPNTPVVKLWRYLTGQEVVLFEDHLGPYENSEESLLD